MEDEAMFLLGLKIGLQNAKTLIDSQLALIEAKLSGPSSRVSEAPLEAQVKKTRNISEAVREQRRQTLAKAREAKLAKLYAAKAGLQIARTKPDGP